MKHLRYLRYVLIHKWYVLIECCKLGVPIRGLLHDLSKFRPDEWFPYAHFFYGKPDEERFNKAWLLHIHRNPHHYQYWILRHDNGLDSQIEMPLVYRKEMVADWVGAGKAQGKRGENECAQWYLENKFNMAMERQTRTWVEKRLGVDRTTRDLKCQKKK